MEEKDKIKAFDLLLKYEINIRFFRYCCDKRRGLHVFNQGRSDNNKLNYEDYMFLRKVIYENNWLQRKIH